MHEYDIGELYAELAEDLFQARRKGRATGGTNNIREKGDAPERAVRELLQSLIGRSFRVTHGHVVRADGRKSKQIDVIVVRDSPAATMHRAENGGAELVRAEWVAAVGEVKSSWTSTSDVLDSYRNLVTDIRTLQSDLLTKNTCQFGFREDSSMVDIARPVTGRKWLNSCYTFLMVLDMEGCPVRRVKAELHRREISADDNAVLVIGEGRGILCIPGSIRDGHVYTGVRQTCWARSAADLQERKWYVIAAAEAVRETHRAGALLGELVSDLQTHLANWYEDYSTLTYSALGGVLTCVRQDD